MEEAENLSEWVENAIQLIKVSSSDLWVMFFCVMLGSGLSLGLLAGPLLCGFILVLFRLIHEGETGMVGNPISLSELKSGFKYFTNSLLVCGLFFVIPILRAIFITLTGYQMALVWEILSATMLAFLMFALPLLITHKYSAIEAIKTSYETTRKNITPYAIFAGSFCGASFLATYLIGTTLGSFPIVATVASLLVSLAINLVMITTVVFAHINVFLGNKSFHESEVEEETSDS